MKTRYESVLCRVTYNRSRVTSYISLIRVEDSNRIYLEGLPFRNIPAGEKIELIVYDDNEEGFAGDYKKISNYYLGSIWEKC